MCLIIVVVYIGDKFMIRYLCMDCNRTLWLNRGICEHCGSKKIHFCAL